MRLRTMCAYTHLQVCTCRYHHIDHFAELARKVAQEAESPPQFLVIGLGFHDFGRSSGQPLAKRTAHLKSAAQALNDELMRLASLGYEGVVIEWFPNSLALLLFCVSG